MAVRVPPKLFSILFGIPRWSQKHFFRDQLLWKVLPGACQGVCKICWSKISYFVSLKWSKLDDCWSMLHRFGIDGVEFWKWWRWVLEVTMEVMSLNFGTDGFDLEATLEVMPLSLGSDSVEFWRWCRWVLEVTMEVMALPFGSYDLARCPNTEQHAFTNPTANVYVRPSKKEEDANLKISKTNYLSWVAISWKTFCTIRCSRS